MNWLISIVVEVNQAGVINMKKIINFLLNKKLLFKVASILTALFSFSLVMTLSYWGWGDLFWFAYSIALIFVVANYTPSLVLYLIEIHQNNLKDIKEQELEEVN